MAKISYTDITALGFNPDMYVGQNESTFPAFIGGIITEQATILQGRIGAVNYASAVTPLADYAKQAEKALVAAEMVNRRINGLLGKVVGEGKPYDTTAEKAQRKSYLDLAAEMIAKVVSGAETDSGSDVAFGSLVTHHFGSS